MLRLALNQKQNKIVNGKQNYNRTRKEFLQFFEKKNDYFSFLSFHCTIFIYSLHSLELSDGLSIENDVLKADGSANGFLDDFSSLDASRWNDVGAVINNGICEINTYNDYIETIENSNQYNDYWANKTFVCRFRSSDTTGNSRMAVGFWRSATTTTGAPGIEFRPSMKQIWLRRLDEGAYIESVDIPYTDWIYVKIVTKRDTDAEYYTSISFYWSTDGINWKLVAIAIFLLLNTYIFVTKIRQWKLIICIVMVIQHQKKQPYQS